MNDAHRKARLNHLIDHDYGRAADFVRATGISKARVSQMSGPGQPFGEAAARKLAQDLGLHEDWFNQTLPTPKEVAAGARQNSIAERSPEWGSWGKATEMQSGRLSNNEIPSLDETGKPPATNPRADLSHAFDPDADVIINQFDVTAGMGNSRMLLNDQPGIIKRWQVERRWLDSNIPSYTSVGNLAIVTGFGPSMRPMFNPGDPLLVDTGVKSITHEGVFFFRVGDEGYIKILQRVPDFEGAGHVLRVISKNPDYPPFEINPKSPHFEVLGKVLTIWRSEHF